MKYSQGNMILTVIPVVLLASVAAAGWYYYYSEVEKYQSQVMDAQLEHRKLTDKQEQLAGLLEKTKAEKVEIEAKLRQEVNKAIRTSAELKSSLEAGIASRQQEVNKALLTTTELKAELDTEIARRETIEKPLRDENADLTHEKSRLLIEVDRMRKIQKQQAALLEKTGAEKLALEAKMQQEEKRVLLTTAELEAELSKRQAAQETLLKKVNTVSGEKSRLLAEVDRLQKLQKQQSALLEKSRAKKLAMEAKMQQEEKRVLLTTAELEAELSKRQAAQETLLKKVNTVSGEKSRLRLELEQEQKNKKRIENLKSRIELELNESRVQIVQLKNKMTVIELTGEVLFNSGSARIKPAGEKVLSIIAESLNTYPDRDISIEGHTDDIPIMQNIRYGSNWELSTARGLAALYYFQNSNRVDPGRLRVVGYGQYRPVASNLTVEGRQRNRRIEIRLLPAGEADATLN